LRFAGRSDNLDNSTTPYEKIRPFLHHRHCDYRVLRFLRSQEAREHVDLDHAGQHARNLSQQEADGDEFSNVNQEEDELSGGIAVRITQKVFC
jgi:hypothetical protein